MWKLTLPSSELSTWYLGKMLNGLSTRIKTKTDSSGHLLIENSIQRILIPLKSDGTDDLSILTHLLIDEPMALHALCNRLMTLIIENYNENEFEDYLKVKNKKTNNRTYLEEELYLKYSDKLNRLRQTFDYDGQLSSNKSRSYYLTLEQGHNTCTYCNRQYIITVTNGNGTNDESRIARPELDHWYSKELFPLMSLSLYNLIPSCSICNSSAKGNTIFRLSTHIHPYINTQNDPTFNFRYKLGKEKRWEVFIDNLTDSKECNMINAFKLDDVYMYHGELEVKDILQYKYQNADSYLKFLLNDLLKHYKLSESDVYRMFFGTELECKDNLNRPLSKLKRDILIQLGILKDGHFNV